jgi:hypothetical protein
MQVSERQWRILNLLERLNRGEVTLGEVAASLVEDDAWRTSRSDESVRSAPPADLNTVHANEQQSDERTQSFASNSAISPSGKLRLATPARTAAPGMP